MHRLRRVAAIATLALGSAGCEGTFTGDLGSDAPADPAIAEVNVSLLGLKFQKSGGGTKTLEFTAGEPVDLVALSEGDAMRLFTDEPLPDGNYTGVRLLFDEGAEATVVDEAGGEFPLKLEDGAYAGIDISVANQKNSSHALTLTVDLRQSLTFDGADDEYTLTPALRAVKTDKAATLTGVVTFDCPSGESLERDGAVYLFAGKDVTPDDLDGTAAEPYATTRVRLETATGDARYALRNVAPGDYTVALTCEGSDETLGEDDALTFHDVTNLSLDDGETMELDLD